MDRIRRKTIYRRNLVHYFEHQGPYFFTFNLHGAIPRTVRELRLRQIAASRELGQERRWFGQLESFLHQNSGPTWLAEPEIAQTVQRELHRWDGLLYELNCYTVMPNHVHLVLTPMTHTADGKPITVTMILHAIKRRSSLEANRKLGRTGAFWQHESYDRFIRSSHEYNQVIRYVLNNPVKAGLVPRGELWPWSYLRQE